MFKHSCFVSAFTRQASNRDAFQRRERFSLFQLTVLCRLFEENPNPTMTTRGAIAEKLSIPSERINVWFQNQRARGFPAKRILQQSFNAASSTNGAARSASIMDSVAMEIVNQSKSDGFLANNTAVVNQYLDNSLTKSEEGINDIHKMLLQYPTDQFQQNVSNSIAVPRSESALISEILGKSDSGNRAIDNRVGTKIKREVESPSPLDKINREMTSDEKVNGYLNHLNQSLSKSTNVTQLDSGGKRKAQTGAAKRKPAFLNKVLPQSQGSLGTPERYTSPYSDPVVTQKNTFNDSSPLSALYRQTASVNFSPPNPSFNYLFDISSPSNLTTRDSNLYGKRLYSPTGSESTKRQSSEVFGELCSDMKRFKADLAAGNDAFQNDKSDSTQNMVTKESSDKEIDKIADQDTRENSTNKEEIKQNGLPKGGNFDDANRALNYTDKTKHTLNGSIAKEMCSTSEPKEDTNELKVNMDTTNREAISTKVSENVTGSTTTAIKFAATDDDSAMRTDENEEFSVNNESLISNTNGLDLSVDQDKNCKRGNDKFVADTGDIDNELSSTYNTDNESLRNKIMSHDIDKPLSKDEMKLFKALYARFVKFHFAQMQFPDIK